MRAIFVVMRFPQQVDAAASFMIGAAAGQEKPLLSLSIEEYAPQHGRKFRSLRAGSAILAVGVYMSVSPLLKLYVVQNTDSPHIPGELKEGSSSKSAQGSAISQGWNQRYQSRLPTALSVSLHQKPSSGRGWQFAKSPDFSKKCRTYTPPKQELEPVAAASDRRRGTEKVD